MSATLTAPTGGMHLAPMSEDAVTAAMRETDSDFAAEQFKTFADDIFLRVQEAWESKDWATIRPYESDKLFAVHARQLQEYIDQKKTNHMDGQFIRSTELTNFVRDAENEMIEVKLAAQVIDFTTDDATGEVLSGSKTERCERTYRLQFIRTAGTKTVSGEGVKANTCPSCGAPIELNQSGRCAYCDNVVTSGAYGWVLNDYNRW